MTQPWGLLALLGIPVIIIIYIIKSQYTEQTVNSTYLWELSEKFLKRRNPLSGLTGLITLILQILMIIFITLAIVQPKIPMNTASRYCFVIDASASMNMESGGTTRFERGKDEIREIIEDAPNGSKFSILYVSTEATMVLEECTDKELALSQLKDLEPSYAEAKFDFAKNALQSYFDNCKSGQIDQDDKSTPIIHLVTDKDYNEKNNVNVINVTKNENNYSLNDFKVSLDGNVLVINAKLYSYIKDASLKLNIYQMAGDSDTPILISNETYSVPAGSGGYEIKDKKITLDIPSYTSIRAVIENSDANLLDNEAIIYNSVTEKQYSTLIVSETPFFFRAAIDSHGDYTISYVTPQEYEKSYLDSKFGLYIFDSYTPEKLPESGTVWMINSNRSLAGTGFSYRSGVTLDIPCSLERSHSTASSVEERLEGVLENPATDVYVMGYQRYSIYGDYTTLITAEGVPVVMTGKSQNGNKMVVFAFSLHDSNLVMTGDYVNLIGNLLDYSFPSVLSKTDYVAGDTVKIQTVADVDSIKVISPLGNEKYLDTEKTENSVIVDEVGTYTIICSGVSEQEFFMYVTTPNEECDPRNVIEGSFVVDGEAVKSTRKGIYNPLIIIFILLAIVFAADWMVFMYEKRQLR